VARVAKEPHDWTLPEIDGLPALSVVARKWSAEIGRDDLPADRLARGIIAAHANGEFDSLGEVNPLVGVDSSTLRLTPLSKPAAEGLVGRYMTLEGQELEPSLAYISCVMTGYLRVRPEAVHIFADARGLPRPSWWTIPATKGPAEISQSRKPNVALQRLVDYLKSTADGQLSEAELKRLANKEFPDNQIHDRTWREAFSNVPKDGKRPPGRPKRT
jgi:hypothetical protein